MHLKIRVVIKNKKNGDTITTVNGDEFMKIVKAPSTQFLQDSIDDYNKKHPEMDAQMEILVSKRGKWKALGKSVDDSSMALAMSTPWGQAQDIEKVITGLTWYSTARHGGLCISPSLANKYLSPNARSEAIKYAGSYWYEEDVQWTIPMYEKYDWLELMKTKGIFSQIPSKEELKSRIEKYFPHYFEQSKGEPPEFKSLKEGDLLYIDREDTKPYTIVKFNNDNLIIERELKFTTERYKLSKKSYFNRVEKVMRNGSVLNR